jgi:predicted deacetylase
VTAIVVTVSPVAPITLPAVQAFCAALDRRGVPASLLVVPGPWSGLHGWALRTAPLGAAWRRGVSRALTGGRAEFAALAEPEALGLLAAGQAVLDQLRLSVTGFAPTGGLASAGTVRALSRLGFRYRLTRRAACNLSTGVRTALTRRGETIHLAARPATASGVDALLDRLDVARAAGASPMTLGSLVGADSRWPVAAGR